MKKEIAIMVAFLLALPFAVSLAITGRLVLDFEPNMQRSVQVCVSNSLAEARQVVLAKQGDLTGFVELDMNPFTLSSGETRCLFYRIALPESVEKPGMNSFRIEATDSPVEGAAPAGMFIVRQSVAHELMVRVPYPGRFLDIEFSAPDVKLGQKTDFLLRLFSRGTDIIPSITGTIRIADSSNATVIELDAPEYTNLAPGGSAEVRIPFSARNIPAGRYSASATVRYDDVVLHKGVLFFIGDLDVELLNATDTIIKQEAGGEGLFRRIDLIVKSLWNDPIENVFGVITLPPLDIQIETLKKNLQHDRPATLSSFIDPAGIAAGDYDGTITLNFADRAKNYSYTLHVVTPEMAEQPGAAPPWYIIAPAIMILLISAVMIILQKRKRGKA